MSNGLTGLLFGVGFGGWVYSIMMRQTGGQAKIAVGVAIFAGLVGFFVVFSLLAWVFST
jgi:hypothetical protein